MDGSRPYLRWPEGEVADVWCKRRKLRPAKTEYVTAALTRLWWLANTAYFQQQEGDSTMSSPTPNDLVSVSQDWLNGVGQTIESAVSVLTPYIQQLLAGQTVQLTN